MTTPTVRRPAVRRPAVRRPAVSAEAARQALVWIDADLAIIVRWRDGGALVERLESDVPAHHRATGHVRHDPSRHGGSGSPGAGESRRLEHLARFVDETANRLLDADDITVIGPGTVREHLGQRLRRDAWRRRDGSITVGPADRLTDGQLVARLRALVGAAPARRIPPGGDRLSRPARPRR